MPSIFVLDLKFQKNGFKLNRLVGLIFEGRHNLTEYWRDLKMVSKGPQRIWMNLQLLFESVQLAIFVTNSVNVLGGALCAPPPFLRLTRIDVTIDSEESKPKTHESNLNGKQPVLLES